MNKRHILTVTLLAGLSAVAGIAQVSVNPASAQAVEIKSPAGVYKLDATHAALLWTFRHLGVSNYTGRFEKLEATLTLDTANWEASSIEVTIDPRSVQTAYPADYKAVHAKSAYATWSEDISRNPRFLNSDNFPSITFKSTKVEKTGPQTARVTGDMTFLGVTKPVTLDATFVGELESHPFLGVPVLGLTAEGRFKRSDFGQPVGGPAGDEVTIRFDGEFIRQAQ
ncbi:MAG: YceI family protein [Pseudochelatococcus sp.]|jgi:polyisoprenoid-binding protein YceI|uniref:YceI family protein n=1 Tax=Pseudochelatococcus sp. TaxID=2020869 RepID=UPI003D8C3A13